MLLIVLEYSAVILILQKIEIILFISLWQGEAPTRAVLPTWRARPIAKRHTLISDQNLILGRDTEYFTQKQHKYKSSLSSIKMYGTFPLQINDIAGIIDLVVIRLWWMKTLCLVASDTNRTLLTLWTWTSLFISPALFQLTHNAILASS